MNWAKQTVRLTSIVLSNVMRAPRCNAPIMLDGIVSDVQVTAFKSYVELPVEYARLMSRPCLLPSRVLLAGMCRLSYNTLMEVTRWG